MKYLFKKLFYHKLRTVLQMTIFFILASLLFISQMMTSANTKLAEMIEGDTDLYFYITGDLNTTHLIHIDKHNEEKEAYLKLFEKIKDLKGIDYADYETFMYSSSLNTCLIADDKEDYSCLYLPYVPENYYVLDKISQDANRFDSEMPLGDTKEEAKERLEYLEKILNDEASFPIEADVIPQLIGVQSQEFPDLKDHFMRIIDGSNFTDEDLKKGTFKAIVPDFGAMAKNDGVDSELSLADTFNISFEFGDVKKSYEFEIIGFHDGISGFEGTSLYRNVYIPAKTLEMIASDYYKALSESASKENDYYQNGELMGIKPLLFNVGKHDEMTTILKEITPDIKAISAIDPDGTPYTYVSSLDDYADAITMSESNSFIFMILNSILLIMTLMTLILVNVFNINANKKDIGVMNALGLNKIKLNLMMFGEFLLVSVLPITLALGVSTIFTKYYAENEFSYQIMKILSGEYNPNFYDNTGTGTLMKKFMIDFGLNDYAILILMWYGVSILAFIISYFKMRKLDPKATLLMGEKE